MDDRDRDRLKVNRSFVVHNLQNVEDVVDGLLEQHVITEGMKEDIEAEKGKQRQTRTMLDILPRRGPEAFGKFLSILTSTENGFIANKLVPEYVTLLGDERTTGYGCSAPGYTNSAVDQNSSDFDTLPDNWPNEEAVKESVKVITCNNVDMKKKWKSSGVYKMHRKLRGRVLIINNRIFSGPLEKDKDGVKRVKLAQRYGSDKDERAVKLLFEQLHFFVNVLKDQKAEDIKNALYTETLNEFHKSADCFILIILSHGTNDGVYGNDGNVVSIEDIKTALDGQNFPCMAEKPKLIFIQACRGETYDYGAVVNTEKQMEDLKAKLEKLGVTDNTVADANVEVRAPTKGHFLIAMASTLDSVSFRNTLYGSWFIQAVVYIFKKFAWKEDILSMLSKVNLLVSQGRAYHGDKEARAVSEFQGTLLKSFYFFPGLYDEDSSPVMHPTSDS